MKTIRFLICLSAGFVAVQAALAAGLSRPNILWITSEDHGVEMGCYGDKYATTPNVDQLAARGMIYTRAWSCAPVCAPARTTLISGMYAQSTGGEHMRSLVPYPAGKQMYPQLLREAGYGTRLRMCSPPVDCAYIPEMSVVRAGAQTGAHDHARV